MQCLLGRSNVPAPRPLPTAHFSCSSWPLQNVFRVYCLSDASREKELKVWEVNAELDELAGAARKCRADLPALGPTALRLLVGLSGGC